jgi:hypothetical protein
LSISCKMTIPKTNSGNSSKILSVTNNFIIFYLSLNLL